MIESFLSIQTSYSIHVDISVGKAILHFVKNRTIMAKYGKKAQKKVEGVMHEFKEGELKSSSGQNVTNKKQAIAIGLSEAREEGAKVPKKKNKKND